MKKIKDFIMYNKNDILVMFAVSFLCLFLLFSGVFIYSKVVSRAALQASQKACNEAYKMMCVQIYVCTNTPVFICDNIVSEQKFCEKETLPSVDVIDRCTEQLRHADCVRDLPPSCLTFME